MISASNKAFSCVLLLLLLSSLSTVILKDYLDYPISKRYKRARIANGSATILTDPIFEIFQNLADLLLDDYHIVTEELDRLDTELDFYLEHQETKTMLKDFAIEMTTELQHMKSNVFEKNLAFISKVGFHFRSILMMFTPIGKFEAPYKVFRKIFDFWFNKIVYFLPNLLGHKFFTILFCSFLTLF